MTPGERRKSFAETRAIRAKLSAMHPNDSRRGALWRRLAILLHSRMQDAAAKRAARKIERSAA